MTTDLNMTETEIFEISCCMKEKHKPLKERLRGLSEQLSIVWESSHKFSIMQEMKLLEDEIKFDEMKLKRLQDLFEQQKSEQRKENYKKQTVQYLQKASLYNSLTTSTYLEKKYNNFDFSDFETIMDLIMSDDFLYLIERKQDNLPINPLFLSSNFYLLYSIWLKLELVEKEVKNCLNLFD